MELTAVPLDIPADCNLVLGQAHFIKVPAAQFGRVLERSDPPTAIPELAGRYHLDMALEPGFVYTDFNMADPKELPKGTEAVIAGASATENEEALIVREPTARDKAIEKFKGSTDKLSGQAADKARELVGQVPQRVGRSDR